MKPNDINKETFPRERFLAFGKQSLTDSELLAILLRTGTKEENVLDLSKRILNMHGIENLFNLSMEELTSIKGIGQVKAIEILALSELVKRQNLKKNNTTKITSAKDVYNIIKNKILDETKEQFFIILLNTKNKIISIEIISTGILDASIIHPREIFKPAIKKSAARIILAHNHPSGDPSPSDEDLSLTENLKKAGEILEIEVLDHVIVGNDEWWSWNERN